MKRMQAIITSGGTAFDNFLPLMAKFMNPLSVQLGDLRSAIVKEAESTLVQAAEACRDSFEGCAERIADTLFKLVNSGTKVLAESGHLSFLGILENVVTWRLVPKIVDNIRSKNAFVRGKSAGYLAYALEHYPKQVFESGESARGRILELIEQGIICAVHDASPEARAAGRASYVSYRTMFVERSDSIYYRLDPSAQKAISDLIGGTPTRHAKTMPAPSKPKPARDSPQPTRPTEEPPKRPSTGTRQSPSITPGKVSPPARPISSLPEKPSEKWPSESTPPPRPPAKPYFSSKPKPPAVEPVESTRFDSTGDTGSSVYKPPSEAPRNPPKQSTPPQLEEDPIEPPAAPKMKTKAKEIGPGEKLDFIIEKTYHENWSTRCNSFTRLMSTLGAEQNLESILGTAEVRNSLWEKLISTHVEHLTDSHFKVVAACLSSLQKLIELLPEKVSYELERIMPTLLSCLGDPKESVYQSSCVVLELIIDLYMADDLLKLVVKGTGGDMKPKMKAKLLEVLGVLGETSEGHFNVAGNVRAYLRKVAALCKDGMAVKQIVQAGARTLQAVRDKTQDTNLECIYELPPDEQNMLRRIACDLQGMKAVDEELRAEVIEPVHKVRPEVVEPVHKPRPDSVERSKPVKQPENPVFDYFTTVLDQCKGQGLARVDGLAKLQKLVDEYLGNAALWGTLGREIVNTLLVLLSDDTASIKETAIELLLKAYGGQGERLRPMLEQVAQGMMKSLYTEDRHCLQISENGLQLLLEQERRDQYPMLISFLEKEDSPALQAIIRVMTRAMKKGDRAQTWAALQSAVTVLAKTLNHSNPDVRKSVVFSLVELNFHFGAEFQPFLSQLSQSQQKLVAIYIQRRQEPYI